MCRVGAPRSTCCACARVRNVHVLVPCHSCAARMYGLHVPCTLHLIAAWQAVPVVLLLADGTSAAVTARNLVFWSGAWSTVLAGATVAYASRHGAHVQQWLFGTYHFIMARRLRVYASSPLVRHLTLLHLCSMRTTSLQTWGCGGTFSLRFSITFARSSSSFFTRRASCCWCRLLFVCGTARSCSPSSHACWLRCSRYECCS